MNRALRSSQEVERLEQMLARREAKLRETTDDDNRARRAAKVAAAKRKLAAARERHERVVA